MKPVYQALDILQREDKAYIGMGVLLPIVTTSIKKLDLMLKKPNQSVCLPLASAIKDGLLKRFGNSLNNLDFILASSFLSHFILKWLHSLAPILGEDVNSLRNRIINKTILLMQAIKSKTSSNSNTANTEDSGKEIFPKASDNKNFFEMPVFLKEKCG